MNREETYIIGIDAGTTGLKSLIFDCKGRRQACAYREYPLRHPTPDAAEQDTEDWWRALAETVREVLDITGIKPGKVAGLSISSQGSSVAALGGDLKPLRPAISWLDRRSPAVERPLGLSSQELFAITGLQDYPGWTQGMLRWLMEYEPETAAQAAYYVCTGDYLFFRLTGEIISDHSTASRTQMFDVSRLDWSDPILDAVGVSRSQLPALGASGSPAGAITAEAATSTGLLAGTPVMLGGFDQSCSALGAGVVDSDTLLVSLGTATMVETCCNRPLVDLERRVTTSMHVAPGLWMIQAPIMTTGVVLRWWRDTFAPEHNGSYYRNMDKKAAAIPAGSDGILFCPHFGGSGAPYWDPEMKGAIYGLNLSHTQAHIYRAILEGVAYSIRENVEVLNAMDISVKSVRVVAGGAVSSMWRGIIGDVLGLPQGRVDELEVGALGAAVLAAAGAGLYSGVLEAASAMAPKVHLAPYNEENHRLYAPNYKRFDELMERMVSGSMAKCPPMEGAAIGKGPAWRTAGQALASSGA